MTVLKWAFIFFILAIIAGLFGFAGIAEGFADIAKVLFGIFLFIVLVLVILGVTVYKAVT